MTQILHKPKIIFGVSRTLNSPPFYVENRFAFSNKKIIYTNQVLKQGEVEGFENNCGTMT
jgi:hypothetical protein